jgi:hypothetical protein
VIPRDDIHLILRAKNNRDPLVNIIGLQRGEKPTHTHFPLKFSATVGYISCCMMIA